MDDPTRLVRDATDRFKLKVSLPGGRYQLSLDDRAVILLTDDLGYSERDTVPNPIVPVLVAMGDAWFPRERDVDDVIRDLPSGGHLTDRERAALRTYLTSNYVQERNVDRVLEAVERTPLDPLTEDDLEVTSLPSIPETVDLGEGAADDEGAAPSAAGESRADDPADASTGESLRTVFEEIPGIGPERSKRIAAAGYASLEELAESRPTDLAAARGLSEGIAAVAIEGARELVGQVPPMQDRLEARTGVPAAEFEAALSTLAAAGVPPSEAEPGLAVIYGPTVGDVDAVTGAQAYFLWEAGYRTPKDLLEASREELEAVSRVGSRTAPRIQESARELLESFD